MKLHLGAGVKRLPGYVHVDARPATAPDHVSDVRSLPFDDDTAELIYFCHGLEHIPFPEVQQVLLEWRRVLKPRGTLRLALPDFGKITRMYFEGESLKMVRYAIMGGQDYPENVHYSVWDFETLKVALAEAGYSNVRQYDARGVLPPHYFDWSIGTISGQYISLNVEATA